MPLCDEIRSSGGRLSFMTCGRLEADYVIHLLDDMRHLCFVLRVFFSGKFFLTHKEYSGGNLLLS